MTTNEAKRRSSRTGARGEIDLLEWDEDNDERIAATISASVAIMANPQALERGDLWYRIEIHVAGTDDSACGMSGDFSTCPQETVDCALRELLDSAIVQWGGVLGRHIAEAAVDAVEHHKQIAG